MHYIRDGFSDDHESSSGEEDSKIVEIDEKEYKIIFSDTAGQDDFASVRDTYVAKGDGFIIFYSVKSDDTIDIMKQDFDDIKKLDRYHNNVVVIANTLNLPKDEWQYSIKQVSDLIKDWGLEAPIIEANIKTGDGIKKAFDECIKRIIDSLNTNESGCCKIF